jgi:predicted Zn-dependent peptidase
MARRHEVSVKDALEIIAAGNTDPDRMVELAQQALKTLKGATK